MSKNVEAENIPKNFQRDFMKMTERQKYSYTLKMSQNQTSLNNGEDEYSEDQIFDYDIYFREQQKKRIEAMDKNKVAERNKLINKSLKEFKLIKKNIYMNRKKYILKDEDAYICECVMPHVRKGLDISKLSENELFGCGDRCSNQLISWDCVAHLCPCKESCRNRRFQLQQHAYVYPVKTENRGWGLCAGEHLPKGTFIMQYIGEIYNITSSYGKKKLEEYKNKNCTYLMSLSDNEVIDPTYKGNLARFINHSCDPNCLTQKWYVLGEQCIGIFTLRDINEGEELTFNYNFDIYKTTFQKCLCNATNCRGYLGVAKNENIDRTSNSYCRFCKNNVKASDKIIACEGCSKIFHYNCTKKSKFNTLVNSIKSNSNSIESPYFSNSDNYSMGEVLSFFKNNFNLKINDVQLQHHFICNSCIKKKIKKDKKTNFLTMPNSNILTENTNNMPNHIHRSNSISAIKSNFTSSNIKRNNKIIYDNDNDEMLFSDNFNLAKNNLKENDLIIADVNKSSLFKDDNQRSLSYDKDDVKQKRSSSIVLPNTPNSKNTLIRMNLEEIKDADDKNSRKASILDIIKRSYKVQDEDNSNVNLNIFLESEEDRKRNMENIEIGEIPIEQFNQMQDNNNVNQLPDLNMLTSKHPNENRSFWTEENEFNKKNFLIKNQQDISNDYKTKDNLKNFFKENSESKNININRTYTPILKGNSERIKKDLDNKKINIEFENYSNLAMINSATEDFFKSDEDEEEEDDNIIIDENIQVDSKNLKIIRANLNMLSAIGARLFWDFRLTTQPKVDMKITGTKSQISKIKCEIDKIIQSGNISQGELSETFYVPKIYVRRIIGHQSRNLNTFKSKYNVVIDYDTNLITDEIFNLTELTKITIKGPEQNIIKVRQEIQHYLYNMKMVSIHLMNTDYSYVKQSICNLKTSIDPADVRLRKKDSKLDREIKHSFYYIPSNAKDLVIIGFDSEVKRGQNIIRDFLLRQNTLEHNQSLCFLCPTYLMNTISNFKNDYSELFRSKNVHFRIIEPNYIRKHLNINLEGKWKDIMLVKNYLFKCFNDFYNSSAFLNFNTSHLASINFIPNKKKSSIYDFLQYTYNQEHKLISKNLRKYFIEKNYLIKNWDYISEELSLNDKYVAESKNLNNLAIKNSNIGFVKKEDFNLAFNPNNFNNNLSNTPNTINSYIKDNQDKEDESYNNQLKTFLKTYDRDTALNYMLNQFPGDYQKIFGMSQIDLSDHLIYYLEEANNSYNHHRKNNESLERNNLSNNLNNININQSKLNDKENKNDENKSLFTDPSEILASEYEPNQSSKEIKKSSYRKRKRSRSISRGNYNKERDYKEREYKEREYYQRERDKDYKDRDKRQREFNENIQTNKNIDNELDYLLSDEIKNEYKVNKSPTPEKICDKSIKKTNVNDDLLDNRCKNNLNNEENDKIKKKLPQEINSKNSIDKNFLVGNIINKQDENTNHYSYDSKERTIISQNENPNPNRMNIGNEFSHVENRLNTNFENNTKKIESKNQDVSSLNINKLDKNKSFLINNITTNQEEQLEIKDSINDDVNGVGDTKIGLAEMKIGNLKKIDISMDAHTLDENFISKISEINKSFGTLINSKNFSISENKNDFSNNTNQALVNNQNTEISNKGSSVEKSLIYNENLISQAKNFSNSNNIPSANANEMMNILYNFSNINQMNINININSNYKDFLHKQEEIEDIPLKTKELDFFKNLENFSFMKFLNNNLTKSEEKNQNIAEISNNQEIKLNFEPIENEIKLLKKKLKSSEFNSINNKPESNQLIDQTLNERVSNDLNNNINTLNKQQIVLSFNEKMNNIDSESNNYSSEKYNNINYENISNSRNRDSSRYASSKYEKKYDKNLERNHNSYHQENFESNPSYLKDKRIFHEKRKTKKSYEHRYKRSNSNMSNYDSDSLPIEKFVQNVNKNNNKRDSDSYQSGTISDSSSNNRKDNYEDDSVGNYVSKRKRIKLQKISKNEKNRIYSNFSSPNLSLNENKSISLSKFSRSSFSNNKYEKNKKPHHKKDQRIEGNSKDANSNTDTGKINNRVDNYTKFNSKMIYGVDNFKVDNDLALYTNPEEKNKSFNDLNVNLKYSSRNRNDFRKNRNSNSNSPSFKSRSISKNESYSKSRSFSIDKDDYYENRNYRKNQYNSAISINSPSITYNDRRRNIPSNNNFSNCTSEIHNTLSSKSNYYGAGKRYDKQEYINKNQFYLQNNRSSYNYNKKYNQYERDDRFFRKSYTSMKYGNNKYRNRFDYENKRSYNRKKNQENDSDSSLSDNSINNGLLKEFIKIKNSKEKMPNNSETKESTVTINENACNNNNLDETQKANEQFILMEPPAQIFSALKKPNYN